MFFSLLIFTYCREWGNSVPLELRIARKDVCNMEPGRNILKKTIPRYCLTEKPREIYTLYDIFFVHQTISFISVGPYAYPCDIEAILTVEYWKVHHVNPPKPTRQNKEPTRVYRTSLAPSQSRWYAMGLLSDTRNCGLRMCREFREHRESFSGHRLQRQPLGNDSCRGRWPAVVGKTFPASPARAQAAILRIW